jgi:hypothetical protein
VFQAIADPTRRDILVMFAKEAMTPNGLAENFHTTRQPIPKDIKIVGGCQLVTHEYSGREIYDYFNSGKLKEFDKWLRPFGEMSDKRFGQLDTVLKNSKNK